MSKKLPYFCWYPTDFEVDENVKLMNIEEVGLYAICLNHSWINGSLPSDPLEIARAMKLPKAQFLRAWPRVAPCFFEREDGRWTNPRQEHERATAIAKSKKATESIRKRYERSPDVLPEQNVAPRVSGSDSTSGSKDSKGDARGIILRPDWDDQFRDFKAIFAKCSVDALIQQDWDEAWYPWRVSDFEQRKLILESVYARLAAGQQIFFKPKNYISKQEYTRAPRAAALSINRAQTRRDAEAAEALKFDADYQAWLKDHPGKTEADFTRWRLVQTFGQAAVDAEYGRQESA